jgi:hypothetical protein
MTNVIPWPTLDSTLPILDKQMYVWAEALSRDLRIHTPTSRRLGSAIAQDVMALPSEAKVEIMTAGRISAKDRLDELHGFQLFMDYARQAPVNPPLVRAQVITQNYVCFVYLGDGCFKALRRHLPPGSTARKCALFLTDNPIRAFRNAIAHANWRYRPDFSGLEFWARKGEGGEESLSQWQVSQETLGFWQALARTTAYATYATIGPNAV